MKIIDGKQIAKEIKESLKQDIQKNHLKPGLAIIMVGDNPASKIYVNNKIKVCKEIGIETFLYQYDDISQEELINVIKDLNTRNEINGILVQSPLPKSYDEDYITNFIDETKDVDGFGIKNLGYLTSNQEKILSATPYGIIKLLEYENIPIEGANVVVVGRSKIVGRPLALALLNRNATVTIAHSKTENLKEITNKADILIVAVGKAEMITADYIKENAVVIDVGINRINNNIVGDVDFDDVKTKASYITPVPGGVGPMTIAMLLSNVVEAAKIKKER